MQMYMEASFRTSFWNATGHGDKVSIGLGGSAHKFKYLTTKKLAVTTVYVTDKEILNFFIPR